MKRWIVSGVLLIVSAFALNTLYAQTPAPTVDPCKAVHDQLAQYAVIVANLQVELSKMTQELQASKAAAVMPTVTPLEKEKK